MEQGIPSVLSRTDTQAARALHQKLLGHARARAKDACALGNTLVEAHHHQVHRLAGYGSFYEYIERMLGYSRRETEERLRVARALHSRPILTDAFGSGQIHWSVVRELTRVATPETEEEWVAFAEGKTASQVERKVAGHRRGDRPSDRPTAEPPKRIRFEVSAPTWALLKEARQKLVQDNGRAVSDDELIQALTQSLLKGGGTRDEGVSAYQVAIRVCERCKVATQKAGPDEVILDEVRLDKALCDAQHLGSVDSPDPPRASQSVPPRVRRAVFARQGGCCAVPGCRLAAFGELHHLDRLADGGTHDPERMLALCDGHHTRAHEGTLLIFGRYSQGFRFEHADGKPYGEAASCPAKSALLGVVLSALVSLGFEHTQAQAMVAKARPHVGAHTSQQDAIQKALSFAPIGHRSTRNRRKPKDPSQRPQHSVVS